MNAFVLRRILAAPLSRSLTCRVSLVVINDCLAGFQVWSVSMCVGLWTHTSLSHFPGSAFLAKSVLPIIPGFLLRRLQWQVMLLVKGPNANIFIEASLNIIYSQFKNKEQKPKLGVLGLKFPKRLF